MAIPLFLKPCNEVERKANIKMFKGKKPIQCPLCGTETKHEYEVINDTKEHWIHCEPCREVFEVSDTGTVWMFHQACSQWEYDCTCLPADDC